MIKIERTTEKAYAKINLTLDITGRRADGYHNIESIMQTVSLADTVEIKKAGKTTVLCSDTEISEKENLAFKAAECFFKTTEIIGGADISIKKRIPKAAGLGGGSSDAAAVLRALDELYKTALTKEQLCDIAVTIGADVPFLVEGSTKLCKGIGEKLTTIPSLCGCFIVIVKKGSKISTGRLYSDFDNYFKFQRSVDGIRPSNKLMLKALKEKNLEAVANNLGNVFENFVPECKDIKEKLIELGALGAALSGSGPSVFGIFDNREKAETCLTVFQTGCYLTTPVTATL